MTLRSLGVALLNDIVVILAITTIGTAYAVLGVTGPTLMGGLVVTTVALLALASIAAKIRALHAREKVAAVMAAGWDVLRANVMAAPGVVRGPGEQPAPTAGDVARVETWLDEARAFVARAHPWFLARYESNANLFTAGHCGRHPEFEVLKDRIEFRLARLGELLREV